MYNLLIVDDEPYILYSLMEMFQQQASELDLDVFCANSAAEALAWMHKTRIDIVMSDISMPGMNGLELMKQLQSRWPKCKVILLTAYPDFSYAQQAVRSGGFDYLLKSEDNETIISAVAKAVSSLKDMSKVEELLTKSQKQLNLSLPILQRDFLLRLLRGADIRKIASRQERFRELKLDLDAEQACLLVVGRIDDWGKYADPGSQELMMYAIQNVAEHYLSDVLLVQVFMDQRKFVWLIQPNKQASLANSDISAAAASTGNDEFDVIRYVHVHIDSIQTACQEVLGLPSSLIAGATTLSWELLPSKLEDMSKCLVRGLGYGHQLLLFDNVPSPSPVTDQTKKQFVQQKINKIPLLENYLESGQRELFNKQFRDIVSGMAEVPFIYMLELFHAICSLFLSFLNKWDIMNKLEDQIDVELFFSLEKHESWQLAERNFMGLSEKLFDFRIMEHEDMSNEIIVRLQRYIGDHIDSDVSLTKLASVVHLSPDYLCRLYKNRTGEGVSDYITMIKITRSKELLLHTELKIHEVADRVGIGSPQYFSRFFKKYTKQTPQEYRGNK